MNLAIRKPMSLAEFLEWEDRQPLRYEFDGVGPVAMTGGTFAHAVIQRNLAFALTGRLRGKPCQFLGSDLKFQVAAGHIRYSDGMILCSSLDRAATVVHEPVVVFEILSPSTTRIDRLIKARNTKRLRPSNATSCSSRIASAPRSTPVLAPHGRMKSLLRTRVFLCLKSRLSFRSPNFTTASLSKQTRSPNPTAPDPAQRRPPNWHPLQHLA